VIKIQSDLEYEAALAELDRLWDVEFGAPESLERDRLVDAITEYEDRHFPIAPPALAGAIEFHMDRLGLSSAELIERVGFDVSEIIAEKRVPTQAEIQALATILGFAPDYLSEPSTLHD
jgi:HTH-type transcriptional regulator/antitoxin HigA